MRIYTRSGDDGTTSLLGGARISKADPRLQCTGALDELSAALGLAAAAFAAAAPVGATLVSPKRARQAPPLQDQLHQIQRELFIIGAHLAAAPQSTSKLPPWPNDAVTRLEREIDAANAQLPPLKNFILPGGCDSAARLHLARTLCRRAERALVAARAPNPAFLVYINRLSDWLFVMARLANQLAGVQDIVWIWA